MNATKQVEAARDLYKQADAEGRDLTAEERQQVERALDAHRRAKAVAEFDRKLGPIAGPGEQRPGDVFVGSEGYKQVRDPAVRPTSWSVRSR